MARLLAYTAPVSGHVYPSTAILLELHRRGHEVHVRTRASDVGRLRRLGLVAAAIDPRIEGNELDDWKASNPIAALQRLGRNSQRRHPRADHSAVFPPQEKEGRR